jgi:hypothetical protein
VLFDDAEGLHLAALSSTDRLLVFPLDQMKELSGGGKGVTIIGLDDGEALAAACVCATRPSPCSPIPAAARPSELAVSPTRLARLHRQARPQGQAGAGPLRGQRPAGRLMKQASAPGFARKLTPAA